MSVTNTTGTALLGGLLSEAPLGEEHAPFLRTAPALPGLEALLAQYTGWMLLPPADTLASTLPSLTRRCRDLTGWSTRDLAEVLHTSHTTVRMLESEGRVTARSRDAASRVQPLLAVLSRLARVAGTRERLALALATSLDTGERPLTLLEQQDWTRAFTVGLDALRAPRPEMLTPLDGWDVSPATREMR